MTRDETIALLVKLYRLRVKGDLDSIMACFVADPVFQLIGSQEASSYPLRVTGQAAFRSTLAGLIADYRVNKHDVLQHVVDGDRAAVHWRGQMTYVPTGREFETELIDFFTFSDGKVATMTEAVDTALVSRLMAEAPVR